MEKESYMDLALQLARKALKKGDIPIGAVIADKDGNIIGKGYNQKEKNNNAVHHAEIIAINEACKKRKSWRLEDCIIYSTLEPCLMCVGAILQSRMAHIVFGLKSSKFGCVESLYNLTIDKKFNHNTTYSCEFSEESRELLQSFFIKIRNENNMV